MTSHFPSHFPYGRPRAARARPVSPIEHRLAREIEHGRRLFKPRSSIAGSVRRVAGIVDAPSILDSILDSTIFDSIEVAPCFAVATIFLGLQHIHPLDRILWRVWAEYP